MSRPQDAGGAFGGAVEMASATSKALPFVGGAIRLGTTGIAALELSQTAQINLMRTLVNQVAAKLAANPELAAGVLEPGEYELYRTAGGFARVYGTALEKLVAREI